MEDQFMKKAKNFFIANWWLLWGIILINTIFSMYSLHSVTNSEKKFKEGLDRLDTISRRVVMVTYDGRVVGIKTTQLDAKTKGFQSSLARTLEYYFIFDWRSLTGDYAYKVSTVKKLYEKNRRVKELIDNFVTKDYPEGFRSIKNYFSILIHLVNSDQIPENIRVIKRDISEYKVDENTFETTVVFTVAVNYYDIEKDKNINKEGIIMIKAKGIFDAKYSTGTNPLGIIFKNIKSKYITKGK